MDIYQRYADNTIPLNVPNGRERLSETIRTAFESGEAMIEEVFARSNPDLDCSSNGDLDELALVCLLIYEHARFCFGNLDPAKGMHLVRNERGYFDYLSRSPDQRGWNGLQLDRGFPRFFCCDPQLRRERLKREIVVMKSLWNKSTVLGSRRFRRIVDELERRYEIRHDV